MDYLASEKARLEKEFKKKKYYSELKKLGVQGQAVDDIIEKILESNVRSMPALSEFMDEEENRTYVQAIFPKLAKKIKGTKVCVNITINGHTMYNRPILLDYADEECLPDFLENTAAELSMLGDEQLWEIMADDEHESHQAAKELLLDLVSGLEKHKALSKLKYAASLVGRKLVDTALKVTDCLSISEMSQALRGRGEYLTSFFDNEELERITNSVR